MKCRNVHIKIGVYLPIDREDKEKVYHRRQDDVSNAVGE